MEFDGIYATISARGVQCHTIKHCQTHQRPIGQPTNRTVSSGISTQGKKCVKPIRPIGEVKSYLFRLRRISVIILFCRLPNNFSSGSCQGVVASGSVARQWSGSHQAVVRQLSGSHHIVVTLLSHSGGQTGVGQWSGSH